MSDLESSSGDEVEYLMASRSKRSNAGNKMKKLLEQELEDMQGRTENMEEDELDLLFQEEENDEEFTYESEKEQESASEEEIGQQETANLEQTTDTNPDEDLMLSESEVESSNGEEDDGEKELQYQEKLKNKRKRQKQKGPIVIRKRAKADDGNATDGYLKPKKRESYDQSSAESLLQTKRRTSKRSSVVANKLKVYEKLSNAEEKREIIRERIRKNKQNQMEEELTQEDRMRIALETEQYNLLSLNKYKEQEVSKKLSRLALQQRQKMKFKNGDIIIQAVSCALFVTPLMEIEDKAYWDEQLQRRQKKKKRKYTRRKIKQTQEISNKKNEESFLISSQESNHDSKSANWTSGEENSKSVVENNGISATENNDADNLFKQENKSDTSVNIGTHIVSNDNANNDLVNTIISSENSQGSEKFESKTDKTNIVAAADKVETSNVKINLSKPELIEVQVINNILEEPGPTKLRPCEIIGAMNDTIGHDEKPPGDSSMKDDSNENFASDNINHDVSPIITEEGPNVLVKQVSFVDEPQVSIFEIDNPLSMVRRSTPDSENNSADDQQENLSDSIDLTEVDEALLYEGPEQLVSKSFVSVYKFPSELINNCLESEIFGSQWDNSLNQRSINVEPVFRITMPKNSTTIQDKSSLIPDLSFLDLYPSFGEYEKKIIHNTNTDTNKDLEIEIKTKPPTGVLLPNGFRKKCLITDKECQYFDPKNGVPYSDVDAYKIIQDLQNPIGEDGTEEDQNPSFYWFGFGDGGIYLSMKQRNAKGVPEGF